MFYLRWLNGYIVIEFFNRVELQICKYKIIPKNLLFLLRLGVLNSAYRYYGHPKLWILRYPAHRYHAVPCRDSNPQASG
jgi:hypothetical protein